VNAREQKLLLIVGGILALVVAVVAVRSVILKPLRTIDKRIAERREKLRKIGLEQRACVTADEGVRRFAQRTFSDKVDQASAKSGEMLTKQILLSGLREADFSRLPVGPRRLGRHASELGWNVQGQGKLEDVIDLMFLLQECSYLHRIENVTFAAGDAPGQVRVGFRFLTLVLEPTPVVDPIPMPTKFTVESPERRVFDGIVARDLLRPYIKRSPDKAGPSSAPSSPAGPGALRVVSLSEWMGQPEVHIRDLTNQKTARYKLGDALGEGTIIMVDYRPLPFPGSTGLTSFSRVILKIGNEYWAVERGQTLADKRRLAAEQVPESLPKL
jgi:hypothetical protein